MDEGRERLINVLTDGINDPDQSENFRWAYTIAIRFIKEKYEFHLKQYNNISSKIDSFLLKSDLKLFTEYANGLYMLDKTEDSVNKGKAKKLRQTATMLQEYFALYIEDYKDYLGG